MVDPKIVDTYIVGKEGFIVGLCESLGIPETINQTLESEDGRPVDIPYGVSAMIMMVNMCHDHRALSRLAEYYEYSDLEGLFHYPVQLDQLNDDRFGGLLDLLYEAGCRKIFTQIAAKAVSLYGIEVKTINFDTTSKVMWGKYESSDGSMGAIKMDFGHSKDKREDKKQIKFGIGCANGLVVDARVLSGNMDDKTYNKENLNELDFLQTLALENAKGESVVYRILEKTCEYAGHMLSLAVCYSESLRPSKEKTIKKVVVKESENIASFIKTFAKREFACVEDATLEIAKLEKKSFNKVRFHDVSCSVREEEKRQRGRPSKKNPETSTQEHKYFVDIISIVNEQKINHEVNQACCFVLCSNDTALRGEAILREYKTQDSVEKKISTVKIASVCRCYLFRIS